MSEHLTKREIDGFIRRTLSPSELLRADDHMENCVECRETVAAALPAIGSGLLAAFDQPEHDPHLCFEQITAYLDHGLDDVDVEIAEFHLQDCKICRDNVRDLENLRTDLATEATPSMPAGSVESFWDRIRSNRLTIFAVPATAVALIGILLAGWYFGIRKPGTEIATVAPPDANVHGPTLQTIEPNTRTNENSSIDKIEPVVSLVDGSGRIEIDADGKVLGLNGPRFDSLVAGILKGKRLEIPPDASELKQSSGELMGEGQTGVPFALSGPVGTIVETTQPTLRWKQMKAADTYRVDVYDEAFNKVASSPQLRTSDWKVNLALRRGSTYRWQVTATANGEEVKSPVRPAPDAKFKVLDSENAKRIADARAQNGRSHLLLGILYAEAGLIADAEREFQMLRRKNPNSEIVRRLLENVRAAR